MIIKITIIYILNSNLMILYLAVHPENIKILLIINANHALYKPIIFKINLTYAKIAL